MTISSIGVIGKVSFGSTVIGQITDSSFAANVNEYSESHSGNVDPYFITLMNAFPMCSFTTTALDKILDAVGIGGINLATGAATGPFTMYTRGLAQGAIRSAGGYSISGAAGMGILKQISVDQSNPAKGEVEVYFISSDGSAAPCTVATAATVADATDTEEIFTLGPVTVNGTAIGGVTSVTIDLGITVLSDSDRRSDGEVYPTHVSIMSRKPSISIKTVNVAVADTLAGTTDLGLAISSTTTVQLQKCANEGIRATAGHKVFTMAMGRVSLNTLSGSNGSPVGLEIKITPVYDGTNAIIALSDTA